MTDRFFIHFRPGNANNSIAIERITIRLVQNSAQCNYWQICANWFSNCTDFRQLLDFCSIVTQCHALITWWSEGWKRPILSQFGCTLLSRLSPWDPVRPTRAAVKFGGDIQASKIWDCGTNQNVNKRQCLGSRSVSQTSPNFAPSFTHSFKYHDIQLLLAYITLPV